jgi:hypothetical protein
MLLNYHSLGPHIALIVKIFLTKYSDYSILLCSKDLQRYTSTKLTNFAVIFKCFLFSYHLFANLFQFLLKKLSNVA